MLSRCAHLSPTHLWNVVEDLTQVGTVTKAVTEEMTTDEEILKLLKDGGEPAGTRTQDPRLKSSKRPIISMA